jgi:uncharacterized membrane protein
LAARAVLIVAIILAGLAAGFFVTYSISVTPGLAVVDDTTYVSAFQGINAEVRNGWFAVFFFGTPITAVLAAVLLIRRPPAAALAGLAALGYLAGVLGLTFGLHVPLNEALAAVGSVNGEAATAARVDFEATWNQWNHLRAVAALGTFLLLLAALNAATRRPGLGRSD